ncbi:hypothetical protein D918_06731 [Trichuris suis]|nr:hypothetical protein D918_06731 [Trichuris suis]
MLLRDDTAFVSPAFASQQKLKWSIQSLCRPQQQHVTDLFQVICALIVA